MADILIKQAIDKVTSKNKTSKARKALQVLQVSASDSNLLVSSPGMVRKTDKKPPKSTIKETKDSESEGTTLRRSKRKNAVPQNEDKEQKEDILAKNPKVKLLKAPPVKAPKAPAPVKAPKAQKPKRPPVPTNQSTLNSFISVTTQTHDANDQDKEVDVSERTIFRDSGVDTTIPTDETTMRVLKSTSEERNLLTDEPGATYWRMLAEERRSALEIALSENEQLKNELEVLEVENGQLKNILQELEKVVEMINVSLS